MNRVVGVVRAGGDRTTAMFSELSEQILEAWNRVINGGKEGQGEREMKVVVIQASLTAGIESGFVLPQVSLRSRVLK